jgi:hypothetical protein
MRVWWCGRNEKHWVQLLEAPIWVSVHWYQGRSKPCLGRACEWCQQKLRPSQKGYAPAQRYGFDHQKGVREWLPVIAELTESVGWKLRDRDLAKAVIYLSRGEKKNSPLCLDFTPLPKPVPQPPSLASWDVRPVLYLLWGYREPPAAQELRLHEAMEA